MESFWFPTAVARLCAGSPESQPLIDLDPRHGSAPRSFINPKHINSMHTRACMPREAHTHALSPLIRTAHITREPRSTLTLMSVHAGHDAKMQEGRAKIPSSLWAHAVFEHILFLFFFIFILSLFCECLALGVH